MALHETEGIGWKTISRLWDAREEKPIAPGMREADLRDAGLAPKAAASLAARLSPQAMEAAVERRRRGGLDVVTWADPEYPSLLRSIEDPPPVLYWKGRPELLRRVAVGVVGTRLATAYGRHVAEEYAAVISAEGAAVVSGMAKGIDTAAHRGALRGSGGTIAVLGTPADQIYPPENRRLYEEIAERGLVLSEAPPDAPYHPGMFPIRNRIISGLSLCVVIVEAPDRSGALITADRAIEQDRPVFIVPGPVTSPRSIGGLRMLREDTARAMIGPEDVLAHLRSHPGFRAIREEFPENKPATDDLPEPEAAVYALLLDGPRTIDELASASGLGPGPLHAALLALQIKRKAVQQPGSAYAAL
ncbi:DNA-processing protein DprA [Cohnella caldifontis]|uniref:DNA-processing protein DprA n=1 Tax=Cohnella caldifontis TaxID=3027471 RepID=UPI0023ECA287|nr:DNA-processing protein DprA [Cohnella sp. YIM B05605]